MNRWLARYSGVVLGVLIVWAGSTASDEHVRRTDLGDASTAIATSEYRGSSAGDAVAGGRSATFASEDSDPDGLDVTGTCSVHLRFVAGDGALLDGIGVELVDPISRTRLHAGTTDTEGSAWWSAPCGSVQVVVRESRYMLTDPGLLWLRPGDAKRVVYRLATPATVRGIVTDAASGRTIANAQITVTTEELDPAPKRTTTDEDGAFALLVPASQQLAVHARAPGYLPAREAFEWRAGTPVGIRLERAARVAGRVVEATSGSPIAGATLEVESAAATASDTAQAPYAALSRAARFPGRVPVNPDRDAYLEQASVLGPLPVRGAGGKPALVSQLGALSSVTGLAEGTSAADGTFTLGDVPAGEFWLVARAEGFASERVGPLRAELGRTASVPTLRLTPTAPLRVLVRDVYGSPMARVAVGVREQRTDSTSWHVTAANGEVAVKGILGDVEVFARTSEGHSGFRHATSGLENQETVEILLPLITSSLVGTVVDTEDTPISGARVTVVPAPSEQAREQTGGLGAVRIPPGSPSATTGSDGTFEVRGVALPAEVHVRAAGFARLTARLQARGGGEVKLVVARGFGVTGHVFNEWTLEPVRHAAIELRGTDATTFTATSGVDGSFNVEGTPGGRYTLTIHHPDFLRFSTRVTLDGDPSQGGVVELSPSYLDVGGSIEGRVVDEYGDPVPTANVVLSSPATRGLPVGTDADGAFVLRGVPHGVHALTATDSTAGTATVGDVLVRTNQRTTDVTVRLPNVRRADDD